MQPRYHWRNEPFLHFNSAASTIGHSLQVGVNSQRRSSVHRFRKPCSGATVSRAALASSPGGGFTDPGLVPFSAKNILKGRAERPWSLAPAGHAHADYHRRIRTNPRGCNADLAPARYAVGMALIFELGIAVATSTQPYRTALQVCTS